MRRRAAARTEQSDFAARDLGDDFAGRNTGDELSPLFDDSPHGDGEALEPIEADPMPSTSGPAGRPAMSGRVAALAPPVRALFTYLARLAKSLTEGQAPESRPVPPAQRAKGIVLVVQVLPDGRRVVFR